MYYYRANDGTLLIVGRHVSVPVERLLVYADSATAELNAKYGAGRACPVPSEPYSHITRHVYWEGTGYAVMLLANAFEFSPHVGIEVHTGEPGCSYWAGPPYGYGHSAPLSQ